jgi:hypothetical protein
MTRQPRHRSDRGGEGTAKSDSLGTRLYAVDRIEAAVAVLIDDVGAAVDVETQDFPRACAEEGAVLRVPITRDGTPHWAAARRDRAEEWRRRADAAMRLERLRRNDPGGDVIL